ncbi:MAG: N-acetylmuramoyl-L-alanine amidase [Steroidobacteraceae bacterium]
MVDLRPILATLLLATSSLGAHAVALRAVTLTTEGERSAQLVLELSGDVQRKLFTLDSPDRIVLDLQNVERNPAMQLPSGAGPVRALRTGRPGNGALRVVLDTRAKLATRSRLERPATPGAYWRLIVDIGASGGVPGATPLPQVNRREPPASALNPEGIRAAHAPQDSGRDIIIAIDAGHGGEDPGAIGRGGTREKDVVLAIARALARRVDAEQGMKAALTRDGDRFIVLRDRMNRARAARADLFVSIHADSIRDRDVSGASVYVLSYRGATNEAARWLAERENSADLKGGVSLGDKSAPLASVLMDLSQTASIGSSMEAAQRILDALDRVGEVRKRQVQQAGFMVLKSPDIPSMLVETAYISNPSEEKRLKTSSQQDRLANAIFLGIREHFQKNPPDGSLFAQIKARGAVESNSAILAGNTGR